MTVYSKNESQPLKWLVALIVFILAMTITFDDAYGVSVPSGSNVNHRLVQTHGMQNHMTYLEGSLYVQDSRDYYIKQNNDDTENYPPPPETVPEPATGILVALGMGVAALTRKFRK